MGFLFFYSLQEVKTRQGVYLSEREGQRDYGIGPAQARSILVVFFIFGLRHYTFHIVHRAVSCSKVCVCIYSAAFSLLFFSFLFLITKKYQSSTMSSWTNFREKITRLHSYSFVSSCARKWIVCVSSPNGAAFNLRYIKVKIILDLSKEETGTTS